MHSVAWIVVAVAQAISMPPPVTLSYGRGASAGDWECSRRNAGSAWTLLIAPVGDFGVSGYWDPSNSAGQVGATHQLHGRLVRASGRRYFRHRRGCGRWHRDTAWGNSRSCHLRRWFTAP